ncbi:lantibiotic dehydratase [Kutzneria sp. NPDC052558]|uniref:lantibiotic dehydratase n=1 Tax=Kutzneria sp. NPDC052558 TaxID=3364121 RepID=UPI0037C9F37E
MALYRPLDWAVVRTPLLPVEHYPTRPPTSEPDARIRRALAVGAGDLTRALDRPPADAKGRDRLAGKLLRYLIRMSTRPTPFGLFAGVGLVGWGEATDAELDGERVSRTRPDMGWLLEFVAVLEREPEVRSGLSVFANPAAFVRADRVFLSQRAPVGDSEEAGRAVSLRATRPVRRAMTLARRPIPHEELVSTLTTEFAVDRGKIERLIEQLWEQTLLLSDLRPPMTVTEPARYVANRLAQIPGAAEHAAALTDLLAEIAAWDELDAQQGAASYPKLLARAESVHTVETRKNSAKGPFQSDMAVGLRGRRIHRAVAEEAARAADLLLRLSAAPKGIPHLDPYRAQFEERYGYGAEVPLLKLLDPEVGLGPTGQSTSDQPAPRPGNEVLTGLALNAIRDGALEVELDEATLAKLETWKPSPASAPSSLDLSVFVTAPSRTAIDDGDFRLVVGPNVGASVAGRTLGRFADLLGAPAEAALREVAEAEETVLPGRIWAEVSYLPHRTRISNVAIRPLTRSHELAFDTSPSGTAVPVDELFVAVRGGRFVLLWNGHEVVPCAGHMLNPRLAQPVIRFLEELARDGRVQLTEFNWGAAAEFPFLPRVRVGRVVLAPASWRVDRAALDDFQQWRQRWWVPRHVYLKVFDHRLLLDLDQPEHVAQLRAEAKSAPLLLDEALPGADQAWLPGPDGHYVSELMVPLVLDTVAARPETRAVVRSNNRRNWTPGSDWLYAKLYHVPTYEEDLIALAFRDFAAEVCDGGLAEDWFFLRYTDPDRHLRIRFRGDPEAVTTELAPRLLRWGSKLVTDGYCRRFALDTYDQEVERYGGAAAMLAAERLFTADSKASADLLHLEHTGVLKIERNLLVASTVDDLLTGLGFEPGQHCAGRVLDRREAADEYRRQARVLREALGDPDWLGRQPGGPEAVAVLAARRRAVEEFALAIDGLELTQTARDIAGSMVHMHCNRLLGLGHPPEQRVLGLVARARESLRHAPLRRTT